MKPAKAKRRETPPTPSEIILRKLRKNRLAMFSFYILLTLYTFALFAGFFAPYSYDHQNLDHAFQEPSLTKIHVIDEKGQWHLPFIYGTKAVDDFQKIYIEDHSVRFPLKFLAVSKNPNDDYSVLGLFTSNRHFISVDEPGKLFLFGSDQFGRDLLSRILFGSRISLTIGLVGITISMSIALIVGGIAGYFGGLPDFFLMRLAEVILTVPGFYMILTVKQAFSGLKSTASYMVMVVVLSFISWASMSRVIRGIVLSLREREYVIAGQALGYGRWRIIWKDILPNTASYVIVTATLSVPYYILGEAALSFLGVGIQEPEASWGNMLTSAQNVRFLTDYPWIVTPGAFIFLAVLAYNFFGDGLRDATDPKTLQGGK